VLEGKPPFLARRTMEGKVCDAYEFDYDKAEKLQAAQRVGKRQRKRKRKRN
jgi:hypothetical protein